MLAAARSNPEAFLDRDLKTFGIDECQLAPELFPALKERVRKSKTPGQYLLTGSIRFTSRKLIRESLTGRIVSHELLPLCLAELHQFELGNLVEFIRKPLSVIEKLAKTRLATLSKPMLQEFLQKGGLPGICFYRDKMVRGERFAAHLDTLLQRDIQLVFETTLPADKILKTLRYIARHQGRSFPLTDLSKDARISTPALKKLIIAMEALFLIRRVATLGDLKKEKYYLEDQGMASHLSASEDADFNLIRLCFSQFLAQSKHFHGSQGYLESFETRSGVVVPLVFDVNGEKTGVIPISNEVPDSKSIAAAESFLRHYPKSYVGIITAGTDVVKLGDRTLVLPYRALF